MKLRVAIAIGCWAAVCIELSSICPAAELSQNAFRPFLQKYCSECHTGDTAESGLECDKLSGQLDDRDTFGLWVKVHDRIAASEMPPADAKQPTAHERQTILAALAGPLEQADRTRQQRDGRTVLRRLNRVEYEYTLRDLLSLPYLEIKDTLPADAESEGFDNVGAALTVSYVQQAAYLKGAERALDQAMVLYPRPKELTFRFGFADPPPPRPDRVYPPKPWHGMAILANSQLDPPAFMRNTQGGVFVARGDGMFRIKFTARGLTYDNREQGGGQEGKVTASEMDHVILLYAERQPFSRWIATFDLPRDKMGELEFSTWLNAGERIRRVHATIHDCGQPYQPFNTKFAGSAIGLESFEGIGPIIEQWPPASHHRLFGDMAMKEIRRELRPTKPIADGVPLRTLFVDSERPQQDAESLIAQFVPLAFRRITPPQEIDRYTKIAKRFIDEGLSFQESMLAAYQAVLCSPDFLYFQEQPGRLDHEALANRLSYFLWRSMPDETLLKAARSGELQKPEGLKAAVERMLNDSRAERFVNDFIGQWLKLREIEFTQTDQELYPEYHEDFVLLDSLLRESRAYFAEMLKNDLGVSNVVDSDFVFINRRLAEHYDIAGVTGSEIRKVMLPPDHVRGGLLTQASVLKVTANGTTTTPVVRGVWLMDRILGTPPPPPPADVPAIEPDIRGLVTVRELLAKHREVATCAMCHKKIDPPGFALESFDVLGGLRSHYRGLGGKPIPALVKRVKVKYSFGPEVDASGETAEGRKFKGIQEFKRILLEQQPQLARNLVERLITYSTGAPVQFADRADVARIVKTLAEKNYGIRSMVHEVVQSRMFQNK